MNRRSSLRLVVILAAILAMVFGIGVFSGCDDDSGTSNGTPPADTTVDFPVADQYVPPDIPTPDQYVWPDVSPQDQFVWPDGDTGYSGTPFGCQSDTDCFGQKCCPTPWGVHLCAPTCGE